MPTSYHGYITEAVDIVRRHNPKSILDVGIGFGKWGHLFREYLDVMHGRVLKDQWTTRIDGVEIFAPYIMDHQRSIYNNIYCDDILNLVDKLPNYDLMFASDVLEHIEKRPALGLIDKIRTKSKKFVAIVPMGDVWLNSQGAMYGNKHEAHISSWLDEDFVPYLKRSTFMCGSKPINLYVI